MSREISQKAIMVGYSDNKASYRLMKYLEKGTPIVEVSYRFCTAALDVRSLVDKKFQSVYGRRLNYEPSVEAFLDRAEWAKYDFSPVVEDDAIQTLELEYVNDNDSVIIENGPETEEIPLDEPIIQHEVDTQIELDDQVEVTQPGTHSGTHTGSDTRLREG